MGNCSGRCTRVDYVAPPSYPTTADSDSSDSDTPPPVSAAKLRAQVLRDTTPLPGTPELQGTRPHPQGQPPGRRLQALLSNVFGLDTGSGSAGSSTALALGAERGEATLQEITRTSLGSAPTSLGKSRAKSVVGYQHILSDAKALAAAKAIPEPVDPRSAWLRPFQPNCLREQVLTIGKDCTQVEGAIAFVDISGFSALTHTLGQQGAKGAMLLSKYINDYLGLLIEVVDQHQGDIVSFAGDAFLALWPFRPTTDTQKAPLAKATACSLALQAKYSRYTVPGTSIVLKIHIGVAYGSCLGFLVEGTGRRLFLLAGRPLITVGDAVNAATSGQVCITAAARALLGDMLTATKLDNGCYLVENLHNPQKKESARVSLPLPLGWPTPMQKLLGEFLPRILVDHIGATSGGAGQPTSTLALQRFLTVLFLGQPELEYSAAEDVKEFGAAALEIVTQNDGEVLQLMQDDKGLHLVAVFGLQTQTTPAIPAIQSVIQMLATPEINPNMSCRIGVATGNAFCGIVGSEKRKAFDILGDTVNLACRLMQLCEQTRST
eukprot:RCo001372